MFILQCPECDAQHLVTNTHILSMHRTSEGFIGYVRCAAGHTVMHRFADAYPKPKPPASVIALRRAQAEGLDEAAALASTREQVRRSA